jgi:hypothetical protein
MPWKLFREARKIEAPSPVDESFFHAGNTQRQNTSKLKEGDQDGAGRGHF